MNKNEFPKNAVSREFLGKIPKPTLEEDTDMTYMTNALIMNECYLKGENLMAQSKVDDAKAWVDENEK